MKPYVAQDPGGGWYADSCGVMQTPDPQRTEAEALRWALDRLWAQVAAWDLAHPDGPLATREAHLIIGDAMLGAWERGIHDGDLAAERS